MTKSWELLNQGSRCLAKGTCDYRGSCQLGLLDSWIGELVYTPLSLPLGSLSS